ncbi:helix-turn-helix domain-containing protein [Isobaculum melis]|uniref:Mga helix-turn-helix domain-containing protein n=1 Tax=Isobaculum melis TaxID=142588 RepID=A0A1H9S2T7_9LACT|nr:helix-turn-helix domain-containing protein [Isobaculum melis]SER79254.1 Mga helix-turn-helix domain-containing protein [Isobaculum melis]
MFNELYKNVLTKNVWIKLDLLHLLEESEEKIKIFHVAKAINVATNTLYKYIKELDDALMYQQAAKIKNTPSSGLSMTIYDKHKYKFFVKQLMMDELGIVILSKLLLGYELSFYQLTQEHFISETSIRRRIKELNHFLSKYDLKIKSRKRHLTLFGDERQIRLFAEYFFWKIYGSLTWPFQEVKKDEVDFYVKELHITKENQHIFTTHNDLRRIKNFIGILIIRVKNGRYVEIPKCLKREKELLFSNYVQGTQLKNKLSLPENEILYLYLHILKDPQFTIDASGNSILHTFQNYLSPFTYLNYLFFLSFETYLIELTSFEKELIYPYVFSKHLSLFLYPKWNDVAVSPTINNHFKNLDKRISHIVHAIVESDLFLLENHTTRFLETNYALIFNLLRPLSYFEEKVSVTIDTSFDILYKNLIIERILSALKDKVNIQVRATDFSDGYTGADMIITSGNKLDWLDIYEEEKIVSIHNPPNEEDVLKIFKKLEAHLNH